jgi:hypothetical protein
MFPQKEETGQIDQLAETFKNRLSGCLDKDETGKLKLTVTLPDESVLDNLARSLAKMVNIDFHG